MAKTRSHVKNFDFGGREVAVAFTFKRVKNLNLRITPGGEVHLSAPVSASDKAAEDFVKQKSDWILTHLDRAAHAVPEPQYQSGETLRILGGEYPLQVREGTKCGVRFLGGAVLLTVREGYDAAKRRAVYEKWLTERAREQFARSLDRMYPLVAPLGCKMPAMAVRKMNTRWGSCMPGKGKINLSLNLFQAPVPCVDYVVLHELCHLKHPNHGAGFYAMLTSLMPDWKERKKLLNGKIPE